MNERPKILIVDDVHANLVATSALLSEIECTILRASSGNDALRLLLKHELAAVLLDVQMPGMDGFEVARLIRKNPKTRNVPIIFLTAMMATDENVFLGYESGAVDVLFKPLNAHMLISKVQVFLQLYRGRKQLAEEVEAHKRTLADLEAFNYSVSHDLRAPLRPLEGFSNILLEEHGAKLDDDARDLLSRISRSARRMNNLIDDLLRLSNVSRARPSFSDVDLTMIANAVVADLRSNDPDRLVEVSVAPGLAARGDAALLRIALENLLRNAWKFTSRTGSPRIDVGSKPSETEAIFFVRDNGVGFDSSHAGTLFRPFRRLHTTAEFEGTGIGLAIVERVIRHHGGRIWADAAPGRGATFSFRLPARSSPQEPG